jgi:holin-like protein
MLESVTVILLCQLIGEIITRMTKIPVPGPVIGMVLLFCALNFCRRAVPADVEKVGGLLLRYLALLFVPAGVGVITNMNLVLKSWVPITAVLTIGTFVTIAVTGVMMSFINGGDATAESEERR